MISPTLGTSLYFPVKYLCLVSSLPFLIYPEERLLALPSLVSYPQCTMPFGLVINIAGIISRGSRILKWGLNFCNNVIEPKPV